MNRFPKYLSYLLDSKLYKQVDFQSASGVSASDISKIAKGQRGVGPKMIEKLLPGFRSEHQAEALTNWILDQIPQDQASLVHIVRANNPNTVNEEYLSHDTLDGALQILKREAEQNPAVRKVVMNLAAAFPQSK